ncbi:MAG: cytochrome P450 [Gammaproteobacteria bacterium]
MKDSQPPGPAGHWLLGSLPEFGADLLGFLTRCSRQYGDTVKFRLGRWPVYLLSDPADIERVLKTQYPDFVKHRFFWRHVTALFGRGLLTSEGELWRSQRRLIAPAFHPLRLADYSRSMVNCTARRTARWRNGETLDFHHEMMRLTGEIVAETLFSAAIDRDMDEVIEAFDAVVEEIAKRFRRPVKIPDWLPTLGNRRYRAAVKRIDTLVYKIIEAHRTHPSDYDDLLSLLLQTRDANGLPLDDRQVRDEAVTLFLAGHETTAIALSWAGYLLSQHPEVETKLEAELAQVLGGRHPEMEDLNRLSYTGMIIKETLRLYPPAYVIGRESVRNCRIGSYFIPKGATLLISPWLLQRDPRYFEEPDEFKPERWAGTFEEQLPRYIYLPFGGGPRVCIGRHFAMNEALLILATIAQQYRFIWQSEQPVSPFPSITLRPAGKLWMKIAKR